MSRETGLISSKHFGPRSEKERNEKREKRRRRKRRSSCCCCNSSRSHVGGGGSRSSSEDGGGGGNPVGIGDGTKLCISLGEVWWFCVMIMMSLMSLPI